MTWDLADKVVVITGGAEGIGYGIANKYLQKRAKTVIILDINEELGNEAVERLNEKYGKEKAIYLKCDIASDNDAILNEIFQSYKVDILVNNAGIADETVPKKMIDINLTSVIECSLKLWEHMRQDKDGNGGAIINISSILGISIGPYYTIYHATKHGVVAFTKSLGHCVNFEKSGVRVMAICPGGTKTNIETKINIWNQLGSKELEDLKNTLPWQNADAVGNAAVEVYERANSGTVWKIEGGILSDVTEK